MCLNRWNSGSIMIRSLPAIPTAGLSLDDMPALMERCQQTAERVHQQHGQGTGLGMRPDARRDRDQVARASHQTYR